MDGNTQSFFLGEVQPESSAIHVPLQPIGRAVVRLLLYDEARVRGAQGADAALFRALCARQR